MEFSDVRRRSPPLVRFDPRSGYQFPLSAKPPVHTPKSTVSGGTRLSQQSDCISSLEILHSRNGLGQSAWREVIGTERREFESFGSNLGAQITDLENGYPMSTADE